MPVGEGLAPPVKKETIQHPRKQRRKNMGYLKDLVSNYVLVSAFFGWFFAQLIKIVIAIFDKDTRGLFNILFSTGGMPSSHSSAVIALCVACGIQEGLGSPLFAITFILAGVVIIDASGVRYETGKQSQLLNQICKQLFSKDGEEFEAGLKELVGHTPFQVLMGTILGAVVAVASAFFMVL